LDVFVASICIKNFRFFCILADQLKEGAAHVSVKFRFFLASP
jgi:hypothetical protein